MGPMSLVEQRLPATKKKSLWFYLKKDRQLLLIILVPLAYVIVFSYVPMYGVQIAFKDFIATKGIWRSPWVGLKHLRQFFNSYNFGNVLFNTLGLSLYSLVAGFPMPILLALSLNHAGNRLFKKSVQMITYAPHFISTVVIVGIVLQLLDPRYGLVNAVIRRLGGSSVDFMGIPQLFSTIYVVSGIWQNMGYNSIVYIATLSGIDPALYEAAEIDGASAFRKMLHIDIPGLLPTAVMLLILSTGSIVSVGFEKVFLLQNAVNMQFSEVISTYVYKVGLAASVVNYSSASAIGLFQSVVGFILVVSVNRVASRGGLGVF